MYNIQKGMDDVSAYYKDKLAGLGWSDISVDREYSDRTRITAMNHGHELDLMIVAFDTGGCTVAITVR